MENRRLVQAGAAQLPAAPKFAVFGVVEAKVCAPSGGKGHQKTQTPTQDDLQRANQAQGHARQCEKERKKPKKTLKARHCARCRTDRKDRTAKTRINVNGERIHCLIRFIILEILANCIAYA